MELEMMLVAKYPLTVSLGFSLAEVESLSFEDAVDWLERLVDYQKRVKKD